MKGGTLRKKESRKKRGVEKVGGGTWVMGKKGEKRKGGEVYVGGGEKRKEKKKKRGISYGCIEGR